MKAEYFVFILLIVSLGGFYFYETNSKTDSQVTGNVAREEISKKVDDPHIKPTIPEQGIIRGKNRYQRLVLMINSLGAQNSGTIMKVHFPDIEIVYIDQDGKDAPYHSFYSTEGNATFVFNNKGISVGACEGLVAEKITEKLKERCKVKDYF